MKEKIQKLKKITSAVPGDLQTAVCKIDQIPTPLAHIFNKITMTSKWPDAWKTKQVTVIPKNKNADDPSQCQHDHAQTNTPRFMKLLQIVFWIQHLIWIY